MDRGRRESGVQNLQPVPEHHEYFKNNEKYKNSEKSKKYQNSEKTCESSSESSDILRSHSVRIKNKASITDLRTKWSSAMELPAGP